MNIINGGVSTESMLYGRMAPSERIGEHKAIPLGFVEGNIAIGYTAEDQFKQRSLAATAFSTKVILVSKPGAQLNNSKMFFESMIISSLDEVKYNGITMQRFNGRCNLIPGRCIYFSIAKLLETELTIADFLNDNWLYNKYVELKTAAQSRIEISIGFDIFDINTTELVFWDKDITLRMANAGDLRLARPQGGMIDLRKNLQSSSDGITKLYKTFINSLYN